MKQLSDLGLNLNFSKRPDFSNGDSSFTFNINNSAIRINFYLNFSSKDIVLDTGYQIETDSPDQFVSYLYGALESVCFLVKRKSLNELSNLDWEEIVVNPIVSDCEDWQEIDEENFFKIPLFLLDLAIKDYLGEFVSTISSEKLICRCFGVTKNSVLDWLKNQSSKASKLDRLKLLTGELLAGGGCTSCRDDLENIIESVFPDNPTPRNLGNYFFVEGVLLITDILKENFPEALGIDDIKEDTIKINWGKVHPGTKGASEFEQLVWENLKIKLRVVF